MSRPYDLLRPSAISNGRLLSCTAPSCSAMRPLLVRSRALAAAIPPGLPGLAVVGVGADEHPPALVVGDDFVEVGLIGAAQRARRVEAVAREWMILEVERRHRCIGWNRIDALLAPGAEQLQRRTIVHLGIVEFRRRRWVHDVAC